MSAAFDCDHVWIAHEERLGRDDYFTCWTCGATGTEVFP